MADEKSAEEQHPPTSPKDRLQCPDCNGVLDRPDGLRDWSPLPVEEQQGETREQDVGATLDGNRYDAYPPTLELLPRHNAMLEREQTKQNYIDDQGLPKRACIPRVDRLRHNNITNEPNGI